MKKKSLRKQIRQSVPTPYRLIPLILWGVSGIHSLPIGRFIILGSFYISIVHYTYFRLFRQVFFLTPYYVRHMTKLHPEFQDIRTWQPILNRCRQISVYSFLLIELLLVLPLTIALKYGVWIEGTVTMVLVGQYQLLSVLYRFHRQQQRFEYLLMELSKTISSNQ